MDCEYCDEEGMSSSEWRTHMLLNHPNKIEDSSDFESKVSKGYLDGGADYEKGEQFGYE